MLKLLINTPESHCGILYTTQVSAELEPEALGLRMGSLPCRVYPVTADVRPCPSSLPGGYATRSRIPQVLSVCRKNDLTPIFTVSRGRVAPLMPMNPCQGPGPGRVWFSQQVFPKVTKEAWRVLMSGFFLRSECRGLVTLPQGSSHYQWNTRNLYESLSKCVLVCEPRNVWEFWLWYVWCSLLGHALVPR